MDVDAGRRQIILSTEFIWHVEVHNGRQNIVRRSTRTEPFVARPARDGDEINAVPIARVVGQVVAQMRPVDRDHLRA